MIVKFRYHIPIGFVNNGLAASGENITDSGELVLVVLTGGCQSRPCAPAGQCRFDMAGEINYNCGMLPDGRRASAN